MITFKVTLYYKLTYFICIIYIDVPSNLKAASTWISGQDYYRLDGKTPKNIRHEMIKRFNSEANKRARVFLISAKAGGQGINLIGANRVIILDTSWNPSNDQQNIFRIFRLGQKKNCYIYRLIAMVSFISIGIIESFKLYKQNFYTGNHGGKSVFPVCYKTSNEFSSG